MFQKCLILAALLLAPAHLFSQVVAETRGGAPPLTVGGYFSYFNTDYASNHMAGVGAFVDWMPLRNLGVEAEGRWLRFNALHDFNQDTYLIGPRYSFRRGHHLTPYAKVLMGAGEINFPYSLAHGGYFALAPGAGVDYRLTRHWRARADYEYQLWPTAVGIPGIPSGMLKPNGVSVGLSYRLY